MVSNVKLVMKIMRFFCCQIYIIIFFGGGVFGPCLLCSIVSSFAIISLEERELLSLLYLPFDLSVNSI